MSGFPCVFPAAIHPQHIFPLCLPPCSLPPQCPPLLPPPTSVTPSPVLPSSFVPFLLPSQNPLLAHPVRSANLTSVGWPTLHTHALQPRPHVSFTLPQCEITHPLTTPFFLYPHAASCTHPQPITSPHTSISPLCIQYHGATYSTYSLSASSKFTQAPVIRPHTYFIQS